MRPFNLEEYLANPSRKVITRDGRNVRIICTNKKGNCPIIALVENLYSHNEVVSSHTKDGVTDGYGHEPFDLFFVSEKKEGWMNLYKDAYAPTYTGVVHNSEEKAIKNRQENAVATIKIEWEE